jgi:hypothetical protein
MHRIKALATTAVVLGVLASLPGTALAAGPLHWRQGGVNISAGTPVAVSTSGTMQVLGSGGYSVASAKCTLSTTGTVENPVGGGAGQEHFTSVSFTGCTATGKTLCVIASVSASNLSSWLGRLVDIENGPERLWISNMTLTETFSGPFGCATSPVTGSGGQESEVINNTKQGSATTFVFGPEADANQLYLQPGGMSMSGRDAITSPDPNGSQWIGVGL